MHGRYSDPKPYKIAVLWRGDAEAPEVRSRANLRSAARSALVIDRFF